ncbi:DUF1499 domain-containing protein [Desulfoprunum benzoelyticum]|uniref:Uncharacterized protein (DUF1499 family) n=1 Tax=Desulfoprunum benzoelyticum TaxID=1506996 RepID=A0A840UW49_9BACT|nr:DUF1499 domain-containing protein [Desulfoprunum benzoelyticum]MBB5347634.1 uncharacterized protein (DUF1499 family) [Desulfoprunum benzoelyticum]MBM9529238.1 DUF1499 domain-containing protein [Desulfoprunum benzoelyticum]
MTYKMILFLLLALALVLVLAILKNGRTPANLGLRQGRLSPLPFTPNAVSSRTEDEKRYVPPLPFAGDRQQTHRALRQAIGGYPGKVRIVTDTPSYIHCVFSSATFGFRDDVEFHLDESSRTVHFRSASRLGYSDLGVNRRRYKTLAALYRRTPRQ